MRKSRLTFNTHNNTAAAVAFGGSNEREQHQQKGEKDEWSNFETNKLDVRNVDLMNFLSASLLRIIRQQQQQKQEKTQGAKLFGPKPSGGEPQLFLIYLNFCVYRLFLSLAVCQEDSTGDEGRKKAARNFFARWSPKCTRGSVKMCKFLFHLLLFIIKKKEATISLARIYLFMLDVGIGWESATMTKKGGKTAAFQLGATSC